MAFVFVMRSPRVVKEINLCPLSFGSLQSCNGMSKMGFRVEQVNSHKNRASLDNIYLKIYSNAISAPDNY